jgi:hypothetical protein
MAIIYRNTRAKKMLEKRLKLREQLWPTVTSDDLWVRQDRDGFTTVPRAMPLILDIMNDLTKGKPVGLTYLALWCRVWDDSFVTIKDSQGLAFEVGFGGQRRESAWQSRMKQLENLGFIKSKETPSGKYGHVLLLNPYKVIYKLNEQKRVQEKKYNALLARAQEIDANDLDEEHERRKSTPDKRRRLLKVK